MTIPQSFDISQTYMYLQETCTQETLIPDISRHIRANVTRLRHDLSQSFDRREKQIYRNMCLQRMLKVHRVNTLKLRFSQLLCCRGDTTILKQSPS